MKDIKGKKVLVVGLGVSGCASARLLAEAGAIVKVTENSDSGAVMDRVRSLSGHPFEFELGGHTAEFCGGVDMVVTSPGISPESLPLVLAGARRIPMIGELELGFRFCKAPIIAITGTNGKTTTTELIGRILSISGRHAIVCGNVGNPLCGEVALLKEDSVAVVEVSSFQLETIKDFRPKIAVLLNITDDHYERHGDYQGYKAAKFRVFLNQAEKDWAVISRDLRDEPMTERIKSRVLFYGSAETMGEGSGAGTVIEAGETDRGTGLMRTVFRMREKDIQIKGAHNFDNIACCAVVAGIMGVEEKYVQEAVKTFKGLSHRFEKVACYDGIDFIDDSKATNVDATRRALESLHKKVVLIAGGRDKGGDYGPLRALVNAKVKKMVLMGEARETIKRVFSPVVAVQEAKDMAEAVGIAADSACCGEAVMLSPMCSSFDMFTDYKERGDVFREEVRRYYGKRR
ncbi:MAG: UDP-N-acetylmuramoyl-L-alanine--D-glutamate ligase [Candidatus Omnitrophota bacterium]